MSVPNVSISIDEAFTAVQRRVGDLVVTNTMLQKQLQDIKENPAALVKIIPAEKLHVYTKQLVRIVHVNKSKCCPCGTRHLPLL